jgi:hypothetical protein
METHSSAFCVYLWPYLEMEILLFHVLPNTVDTHPCCVYMP